VKPTKKGPLWSREESAGDDATAAAEVRARFVEGLEEGRRLIASKPRADGTLRDGSHKSLAAEMKVSPTRVGEFLRDYWIGIAEGEGERRKRFDPPRLRKSVAGFTASAERALSWMLREGVLTKEASPTAHEIVKGYWPPDYINEFYEAPVQAGINEGQALVQRELDQTTNINVEFWVVNWGPFGGVDNNRKERDFFLEYGSDLIRAIDPIGATVKVESKSLAEILELPARDRHKGLAIGMGPFETLHRRFRGLEFVSFPVVQFPIVSLLLSKRRRNRKTTVYDLSTFLNPEFPSERAVRVVVKEDVGHLVLFSMLPDGSPAREDAKVIDSEGADRVVQELQVYLEEYPALAFISDGMLAAEVFSRFRNERVSVEVVTQKLPEPEFLFSLGILLRREDHDVASLLQDAQKQIFRSDVRVRRHFGNLLDGIEDWMRQQQITSDILRTWKQDAPIFLIQERRVKAYISGSVSDPGKVNELASGLLEYLDARRKKNSALKVLLQIHRDRKV
jgi:hypothetical protein